VGAEVLNKFAMGLYGASAVLPPLVFLVADASNWSFWWLSPNYCLAFSLVAIALAMAQASFVKRTILDVAAAILWLATCSFMTLHPFILPPWHPFKSLFDVVQVVFARPILLVTTAFALSEVAVRVGLGRRSSKCVPYFARQLSVLGVGILALYLVRGGALWCRAFARTGSEGIRGIIREGRLLLLVASMIAAMLVASTVIAHFACRKKAQEKA
jgi:hypothetical protein